MRNNLALQRGTERSTAVKIPTFSLMPICFLVNNNSKIHRNQADTVLLNVTSPQ